MLHKAMGHMSQPGFTAESEGSHRAPTRSEGSGRPGLTPVSLLLVLIVGFLLYKIQLVLVLVLLAVLFATVIDRPVGMIERKKIPRPFAILFVYIGIIGAIVLGGILVSPMIGREADRFREEAPAQIRELRDSWLTGGNGLLSGAGADALDRLLLEFDNPSAPPEELTVGIVAGIGGGLVGLLTVLVMAFYYLMEKQFLRRLVLLQVTDSSRERVARVWDSVEAQVGRWLRGQLILCMIIGTASLIGYGAMGVRFWPLLGLWAGLTEIIPIVGPWLGGIPAVIIAMTQSWDKALLVVIFVVFLQFMENTILVPRVMKGAVGLTPLTVFVAILAGTQYLSVAGALLAIPVAAAVQVILADYFRSRRGADATDTTLPNWRWMRGQFGVVGSVHPHPGSGSTESHSHSPSTVAQSNSWSNQFLSHFGNHSQSSAAEPTPPATPAPKD